MCPLNQIFESFTHFLVYGLPQVLCSPDLLLFCWHVPCSRECAHEPSRYQRVHALAHALLATAALRLPALLSVAALCGALQVLLVVLEASGHGGWILLVPLLVLMVR